MLRVFLMLAAFFGFTGVALGAFAAHGLKSRLSEQYLAVFHTGVTYQLVHTLALLGVALLATQLQSRLVTWAGLCFAVGIVLFSGSLYLFSLRAFNSRGAAAACRERYAAAFALYKYFIPAFIWIERVGYQ